MWGLSGSSDSLRGRPSEIITNPSFCHTLSLLPCQSWCDGCWVYFKIRSCFCTTFLLKYVGPRNHDKNSPFLFCLCQVLLPKQHTSLLFNSVPLKVRIAAHEFRGHTNTYALAVSNLKNTINHIFPSSILWRIQPIIFQSCVVSKLLIRTTQHVQGDALHNWKLDIDMRTRESRSPRRKYCRLSGQAEG